MILMIRKIIKQWHPFMLVKISMIIIYRVKHARLLFAYTSFLCCKDRNLIAYICAPEEDLHMRTYSALVKYNIIWTQNGPTQCSRPDQMYTIYRIQSFYLKKCIAHLRISMDFYSSFWMYQIAFFLDPNPDTVVRCLESCCSEACPPRFSSLSITSD